MRIVCGAILVATVMTSSAVAADVADDLSGAKWIGGNPVTLPDYDFGAAAWIAPKSGEAALTKTVVLAKKPETAELVVAAHGWFSVKLPGGELSSAWSRKDGKTELTVHVPDGTRAFVNLPGERECAVGPGAHTFAVKDLSDGAIRSASL